MPSPIDQNANTPIRVRRNFQRISKMFDGLTTVTSIGSVALVMPSILSVAGSPLTTSGTITVTLATQTANFIFAGPTTGIAAAPAFRALVAADIPSGGGSPLTTKGDIYVFSNSNTRLPVGSNGQILIPDSTQTTGLKWSTTVMIDESTGNISANGFHGTSFLDIGTNYPSPPTGIGLCGFWRYSNGFVFESGNAHYLNIGGSTVATLTTAGWFVNSLTLYTSHTPSSAADTGTAGTIAWDSSFIYVCVAANTWKRVAIATW